MNFKDFFKNSGQILETFGQFLKKLEMNFKDFLDKLKRNFR